MPTWKSDDFRRRFMIDEAAWAGWWASGHDQNHQACGPWTRRTRAGPLTYEGWGGVTQ